MFSGKLVRIRGMEKSDLDHIMQWVNNPEITRFLLAFTVPMSRAMEEKWLDGATQHTASDKFFALETLAGEYLGGCGFHHIDAINRHTEIGIAIGKESHLGQGYGEDAVKLLLRVGFHALNLNKIYLRVFAGNSRAIRCYVKCGFKEVGRHRQHRFTAGEWHDEIIMEVLRSEWETRL
ncbi:MAG: Spermidine N(1)-acetyltransferase [Firmicutes bacterium]|nr:Spermidine N(1)-acetyltransferase [Bacillota bacterium]